MPRAHIAIDLETLSTTPNAKIISIGAVAICQESGLKVSFYTGVSADSQDMSHTSRSTAKWWSEQSAEARTAFDFSLEGDAPGIKTALRSLTEWISKIGETHHDVFIWGNGATFDVTILESAYYNYDGMFIPWNFRKVRDMRTLREMTDTFGLADQIRARVQRTGTHHNALDDADYQARLVITSLELLLECANSIKLADKLALEMMQ